MEKKVEIYVGDQSSIEKIVSLNSHCKQLITITVEWGNEIDKSNTHIGCIDVCYNGILRESIKWECLKYTCNSECHDTIKSKLYSCLKDLIRGRSFNVIFFSTNNELAKLNVMKRIIDCLLDTNCCDCICQYRGLFEIMNYILINKPLFDAEKKAFVFDDPSLVLTKWLPMRYSQEERRSPFEEALSRDMKKISLENQAGWVESKSSIQELENYKTDKEYSNFIEKYKQLREYIWGNGDSFDPFENYIMKMFGRVYPQEEQ